MKSRTDIAEGKPLGVWFPRRNRAALVRLTRGAEVRTVDANEQHSNEDEGGESGGGGGNGGDAYAAERAALFDA